MRKKVERNRRLYEDYLRQSDKYGSTYEDIGKQWGISASRAFRIVKAEEKRRAEKMKKRTEKIIRRTENNATS